MTDTEAHHAAVAGYGSLGTVVMFAIWHDDQPGGRTSPSIPEQTRSPTTTRTSPRKPRDIMVRSDARVVIRHRLPTAASGDASASFPTLDRLRRPRQRLATRAGSRYGRHSQMWRLVFQVQVPTVEPSPIGSSTEPSVAVECHREFNLGVTGAVKQRPQQSVYVQAGHSCHRDLHLSRSE